MDESQDAAAGPRVVSMFFPPGTPGPSAPTVDEGARHERPPGWPAAAAVGRRPAHPPPDLQGTSPPDGGLRAGLDIGGTKIDAVLLLPDGSVCASARRATPAGEEPLVEAAAALLDELLAAAGPGEPAGLSGVGVGIPGVVDPLNGTVTDAVNLQLEANTVPFAKLLSARLAGIPVRIDNDVNVCALGAGSALGPPADLALLSIGTGVAAGILQDGVLRRGHRGAAGEIGHLVVDLGGHVCGCGQRGCLETVVAGPALQRRWSAAAPGEAAGSLFLAAERGDARAHAVRDDWANSVAVALQGLALTLDPHHLVLAGGVCTAHPSTVSAVAAALRRLASGSRFLTRLGLDRRLSLVDTGSPVAAVGAALLVPLPRPS